MSEQQLRQKKCGERAWGAERSEAKIEKNLKNGVCVCLCLNKAGPTVWRRWSSPRVVSLCFYKDVIDAYYPPGPPREMRHFNRPRLVGFISVRDTRKTYPWRKTYPFCVLFRVRKKRISQSEWSCALSMSHAVTNTQSSYMYTHEQIIASPVIILAWINPHAHYLLTD